MLPTAETVRSQRSQDALLAARVGRRLGEWSWRLTGAALRTLIAAAAAAAIWHALVPAMAFGAFLTGIIAVRLLMQSAELLAAAARRQCAVGLRRERK